MFAWFFFIFGGILLFISLLELIARGIDKYEDWRDFDRERRELRRALARGAYWDRICQEEYGPE